MTYPVAISVIGLGFVALGGLIAVLKLRRNGHTATVCPLNAGAELDHLAEAIHELRDVLREIRDKLVGMGYQQDQAINAVGRVETSLQAMHRRFDGVTGPRE